MVPRWSLVVLFLILTSCQPAPPASTPGAGKQDEPPEPLGPPLFEDVTAASGLTFSYRNGEEWTDDQGKPVTDEAGKPRGHLAILESLGGGVGLIDYDGDGLLDVFLTGGGYYADAPEYHTIKGYPCKLFRNLGGCKYKDVTAEAGLDRAWFYSHGSAVADYDRDGWSDLLVTGWGGAALFHNEAADAKDPKKGRRLVDVTAKAGLDRGLTWTTSAGFADLDGDGYPDLYLCQYVDWSWQKNPSCNYDGKTPDVCPPKNFDGLPHKVFLNDSKGGFRDVSQEAKLHAGGPNASKGLGVVIVDVDGDGKPDVYVANDTVDNFLYLNQSKPGQIAFVERGLLAGVARDAQGKENGSMGVDAGDPERTGRPALWVTNYENELHMLYGNESKAGRVFFQPRSAATGIARIGQKFVGWGTAFLDADLDGWEDLFIANGHAIRFPTGKDSSRKQKPVLLHNREGKFKDVSQRIGDYYNTPHLARGIGFGDLDNDGRIDMVICHTNEPAVVLRGVGGQDRHWLGVELVGKDRACVVGARARWEVGGQRQTRFAKAGGSYAASGDRRMLFGLGDEKAGRLTVTWPDGTEQVFADLQADRYYRVVQGKADASAP